MKKLFWMMLISTFFILGACSSDTSQSSKETGKLLVTTTTSQIADAVKNIGGDRVEVKSLMGPGIDPHLYKATQGDIAKLQRADVIFYNGLHLEGKMLDVLEKMNKEKPTYAIGDAIGNKNLLLNTGDKNVVDPHIWFDIDLWLAAIKEVEKGLILADPDHQQFYEENAKMYYEKLNELKDYAQDELARIPAEQRVLVTAHDAFGYFGAAYQLEVRGLQGLSTDSEYGLGDVQKLVDLLVTRKIKAVFIESSISERSINAVIEGAKKKGHEVRIGGELFSDAMGEEGTEEGTYIGMYKHNVRTIVNSLK